MSRRAKKQQSDRAPASGTRFSNERPNQRKKQRVGQRGQERRRSKALLAVVPSDVSNSAPPDSVAAAARGSAELAPPRGLASLPRAPNAAAEHPLSDEALLDVERSFFQGGILSEPAVSDFLVTESQPAIDDDDALLLTPEQQQRRRWFRRQVTRLVAGMGAFGTIAMAVRIASLL
jgi:hypothetical protein